MSTGTEKERLINDIVRLRRAERLSPSGEDIATVRGNLERMVGPTVRRAMAARLLGVSQTALDRWIAQGDIPAVVTPTAGREVPVSALVELIQALEDGPRATDDGHALASLLRRRRADAARLDPEKILLPRPRRGRERGHSRAELRGLAYHRAVAQRLDRGIVDDALGRLRRWRSEDKIDHRYAEQWEQILSQPLPQVAELITADSQRGRDLRQSSPFAGTLNEQERRRILEMID
ncbi:MAG: hypothetical protein ACR2NB_02370 [Solirubrobacteraceae bacterium]